MGIKQGVGYEASYLFSGRIFGYSPTVWAGRCHQLLKGWTMDELLHEDGAVVIADVESAIEEDRESRI